MTSPEVNTLIEMGFSPEKAEKALSVTGNKGVEPAMEWLLSHSDDIVESIVVENKEEKKEENQEKNNSSDKDLKDTDAKSVKCNDCDRVFESFLEVEYHAVKSGHSNFSESMEPKKPLTEEEKREQLRLLEEKMRQKRKEREEKERKEEVEREKRRIQSSKEISAAKEKMKEVEMKKLIEQRKREKLEDQKARERVRAQIEADKAARKQKFGEIPTVATAPTSTESTTSTLAPISKPQRDYNETRLQIRLTNGDTLTQTFGSKEQLSAVRLYIIMNRTDGSEPFSLMTNFPKKIFCDEDFEKPLDALGLTPSAVIIVSRKV